MGEKRSVVIIGAAIVVVVGLIAVWAVAPGKDPDTAAPLNEITDLAAIQQSVEIARLGIATSENYVGHKIRVIGSTVKNVSDKPIRMLEVKMVFTDYNGNSVHEYSEQVLKPVQKPLDPGQDYRFEMRVENLPRNWNYRVPVTQITRLGY
jgi:hypothetical protein